MFNRTVATAHNNDVAGGPAPVSWTDWLWDDHAAVVAGVLSAS